MHGRWSGEAKYRTLLAVAQAANSRRDLPSVMDAVASALEELVPVDLVGVVLHEGERRRPIAGYLRSAPRHPDESPDDYMDRLSGLLRLKEETPEHAMMRQVVERDRQTLVFNHVRDDPRLDRSSLRRTGAECAVLLPLTMDDEFVAAMVFARMSPSPFLPDEVSILQDVARPVATAVANALAFEEIQRLRSRLEDENLALQEEIAVTAAAGGIIGASQGLRAVLERVSRVAATDSTVLITGETGTGKELVARAIHTGSPRAKRALVKVNCAALPEGLVASELFGHEKGAFTGALERRRGRFELAVGGTIFLDEIGELPAPVQVALLRVLQEREFERVGGSEMLRTDARVVSATNRDLEEAVREGRFRADLFFRLNVFPIRVPPLRERSEDIPLLAEYWASRYARQRREGGPRDRRVGHGRAVRVSLARQHPRAAERRRARGHPRSRERPRPLRFRASEPRLRALSPRARRYRRRAPADRRRPGAEPRPGVWSRGRGGGARCPTEHARSAHPPPRHRQARVPPSRSSPVASARGPACGRLPHGAQR